MIKHVLILPWQSCLNANKMASEWTECRKSISRRFIPFPSNESVRAWNGYYNITIHPACIQTAFRSSFWRRCSRRPVETVGINSKVFSSSCRVTIGLISARGRLHVKGSINLLLDARRYAAFHVGIVTIGECHPL